MRGIEGGGDVYCGMYIAKSLKCRLVVRRRSLRNIVGVYESSFGVQEKLVRDRKLGRLLINRGGV